MKQHPAILYVEDNLVCRTVMKIFLELRLGLPDVTVWDSSDNFARRLAQLAPRPDLIFLDLYMQPLDGFAMIDLVRRNPRYASVPVVALTVQADQTTLKDLQMSGFNGCLTKPLNLYRFPHVMQQILNGESVWMPCLEPSLETR